jgi:hypothetical protein
LGRIRGEAARGVAAAVLAVVHERWRQMKPTAGMPNRLAEDDADLVRRARAGDSPAFEDLVLRNAERLYMALRRLELDDGEAQEGAQETFLRPPGMALDRPVRGKGAVLHLALPDRLQRSPPAACPTPRRRRSCVHRRPSRRRPG